MKFGSTQKFFNPPAAAIGKVVEMILATNLIAKQPPLQLFFTVQPNPRFHY